METLNKPCLDNLGVVRFPSGNLLVPGLSSDTSLDWCLVPDLLVSCLFTGWSLVSPRPTDGSLTVFKYYVKIY